ncbi:MAG: CinA family nicotinamide mononucleotide deamidase-related protein [Halieaceae bacterium]|jgi:nicotinamide-nucleotide amidase|nr:CinA family nicotinamide mononucleotide deamidase-related protein [Halieaceae bacterium]
MPRIQLLLTGNEIMSGDTVDSNSAMIAQVLGEQGLHIQRKVTLGDDSTALTAELSDLASRADVIIINGGLGPTVDDLTAEILAEVAGVPLAEHPQAREHVETWCARRGATANAANLKQALLPEGCRLVPNSIGSAVGFQLQLGDCLVVCTPGVPGELRAMLPHVLDSIAKHLGDFIPGDVLRLQTFGLGESTAQQLIADAGIDWPASVDLGFRAGAPQMEIKLSVSDRAHSADQQYCREALYGLFGDHIIGEGDTTLAQRVLHLLADEGSSLATAESCTGGLIASMLTRVPGSSAGFQAGFVTYSNAIKSSVLGVSKQTLETEGAVSEAVVVEMVQGALRASGSKYAVAVSGIAGPDGGSPEKPVGTVWLAWGREGDVRTRGLCWPVERTLFQTMIAAAALDMVRRMLLGLDSEPRYFSQRRQR